MTKITKVPQVAATPKPIEFETVMQVDPRLYTISPWNVRLEESDRNIKSLTDSILEIGIRQPLLADENKNIIDGHRRHSIAIKYLFMIPVIHRRYGDTSESNVDRVVDSMTSNLIEANTTKELGLAVNKLIEQGMSTASLAKKLGYPVDRVRTWSAGTKAPEEIPVDKSSQEIYESMSQRERKQTRRMIKKKQMSPEEAKEFIGDFHELPHSARDGLERDLNAGMPLKVKEVVRRIKNFVTELWELHFRYDHAIRWRRKIKSRGWERGETATALFNKWTLGLSELTIEEYETFGSRYEYEDDR